MSRIFLLACGVLYLGFGLWVVLSPETSLAYMEISPYSTNALSDLRGSHGGLNVAVGLFFQAETAQHLQGGDFPIADIGDQIVHGLESEVRHGRLHFLGLEQGGEVELVFAELLHLFNVSYGWTSLV